MMRQQRHWEFHDWSGVYDYEGSVSNHEGDDGHAWRSCGRVWMELLALRALEEGLEGW